VAGGVHPRAARFDVNGRYIQKGEINIGRDAGWEKCQADTLPSRAKENQIKDMFEAPIDIQRTAFSIETVHSPNGFLDMKRNCSGAQLAR
jgi:hypothetical protein